MKNLTITIAFAIGIYMDSVLFARLNLSGICPCVTLAVAVSAAVMTGWFSGVAAAGLAGLFMDLMFGKLIGLNAAAFVIAGAAGCMFNNKFYADNIIIPADCAFVCALVREHISAAFVYITGGTFSYIDMLSGYMLPCALLTGGVCMLAHAILRPLIARQSSRYADRHIGGVK